MRRHKHNWQDGGAWSDGRADFTYRQCHGCGDVHITFVRSRHEIEPVVMLWLTFGYAVTMEQGAMPPHPVSAA